MQLHLSPVTGGPNCRARHRNGFTLIELLVVIAIIAILAGILFPVFARAREGGRRTACLSNLKQLMLGVIQYSQDYDEYLPASLTCIAGQPVVCNEQTWYTTIDPYVKDNNMYFCPDDTLNPVTAVLNSGKISYGMNFFYNNYYGFCGAAVESYGCGSLPLAKIQNPSLDIFLGDTSFNTNSYIMSYEEATQFTYTGGTPGAVGGLSIMHMGGANLAFVDGHAKWEPIPGVVTTGNQATYWMFN